MDFRLSDRVAKPAAKFVEIIILLNLNRFDLNIKQLL